MGMKLCCNIIIINHITVSFSTLIVLYIFDKVVIRMFNTN